MILEKTHLYNPFVCMPPVKPICKSSKSCNKLPLELKSGGKVWNAKDGRSREYWEQELSEYWDSGLTVQEYSELKELPYESVRRWIRRLKQERPGVAKVDFVEVKAPSVPISTGASGIRLKFGGWEIELSSDFVPETLSEVLDVFEER